MGPVFFVLSLLISFDGTSFLLVISFFDVSPVVPFFFSCTVGAIFVIPLFLVFCSVSRVFLSGDVNSLFILFVSYFWCCKLIIFVFAICRYSHEAAHCWRSLFFLCSCSCLSVLVLVGSTPCLFFLVSLVPF